MSSQWQIETQFTKIDKNVIEMILDVCSGNPLLCLNYFVQLLHRNLIQIKEDGRVCSTDELEEHIELKTFHQCPIPLIAMKQNMKFVD